MFKTGKGENMGKNLFENTMVEMTWQEIDKKAKENALVILPLGVIEEHGYHLPLGTDIYLAVSQAWYIKDEMEKDGEACIIAPPYYWGTMAVVTKNFPGSFTARPETIRMMILDILESLEHSGFQRVLTTNAHGDGLHQRTIWNALKEYNENSEHHMNARWLIFEDEAKMNGFTCEEDYILAVPPYDFEKMVHGLEHITDQFDVHAGAFETACMREAFPEFTDMDIALKMKATMLQGEQIKQWHSGKTEYNMLTPEGHVGDPAASAHLQTEMEKANRHIARDIMEFYKRH